MSRKVEHEFSEATREYLERIPAVEKVGKTRITYAAWFRREALRRYRRGERPSAIFSAYGIGPDVIGGKRIERCMHRWKNSGQAVDVGDGTPQGVIEQLERRCGLMRDELDAMRESLEQIRGLLSECPAPTRRRTPRPTSSPDDIDGRRTDSVRQ